MADKTTRIIKTQDAEIEALRREVRRLREIVDKARKIIEDHDAKHGIKNEA